MTSALLEIEQLPGGYGRMELLRGVDLQVRACEIVALLGSIFIKALRTPQQMDAACAHFAQRVPLLSNMVEGGQTPLQSVDELTGRGFRIVIFPGGAARAVAHSLAGYYGSLRAHGSTLPWRGRMLDFDGLNEVIGTDALLALGKRYE